MTETIRTPAHITNCPTQQRLEKAKDRDEIMKILYHAHQLVCEDQEDQLKEEFGTLAAP